MVHYGKCTQLLGDLDFQNFTQKKFYNNERSPNKVWESGSSLIGMKSKAWTILWLSVEMSLRGDRWQTTRVSPKSSRVTFCQEQETFPVINMTAGFRCGSKFGGWECRGSSNGLLNVSWGCRRQLSGQVAFGLCKVDRVRNQAFLQQSHGFEW